MKIFKYGVLKIRTMKTMFKNSVEKKNAKSEMKRDWWIESAKEMSTFLKRRISFQNCFDVERLQRTKFKEQHTQAKIKDYFRRSNPRQN